MQKTGIYPFSIILTDSLKGMLKTDVTMKVE
jgi:hypothetical protein